MTRLTKKELRDQQHRLEQMGHYLPILNLKKMLLQMEVHQAEQEKEILSLEFDRFKMEISSYSALFSDPRALDLFTSVKIDEIKKGIGNIAGIEFPIFLEVLFKKNNYLFFDTPIWIDRAIAKIKSLIVIREKIKIVQERKNILSRELYEVSVRINLFDKILIPRARDMITRIKIFLGDQQLMALCQSKIAKKKLPMKKAGEGR